VAPVKFGAHELGVTAIALSFSLGCSAAEVTRPSGADDRESLNELLASVNSRCPDFGHVPSAQVPRDDLFVEAVILDVPSASAEQASLATLQRLARTEQIRLVAAPHILGTLGHRSEMGLGRSGATEQLALARMSLLPRHADRSAVLELELELDLPSSSLAGPWPRRTVAFSATAREGEPALARVVWDEASKRSLLVLLRTFEIRNEDDLRAVFQCKMLQRARALRRVGTGAP
jgi:hypothetical protein